MSSVRIDEMTWHEIGSSADRDAPVFLPSGAITQYGPHLPVGTNSIIATRLSEAAAEQSDGVVLPPLRYGFARSDWPNPGNIRLTPSTLTNLTRDVLESTARWGFHRFILVYGQLPNITSLVEAAEDVSNRFPDVIVAVAAWWQLAGSAIREIFPEETGYHAMSAETSLMMHFESDLVREDLISDDAPPTSLGYDLFPRPRTTMSSSGVVGNPSIATQENGRALATVIVERLVKMAQSRDLALDTSWSLLE